MTTPSSLPKKNSIRVALAFALFAVTQVTGGQMTEETASVIAASGSEMTAVPMVRPSWQRPAPATWSSRFNVRWEARWGSEGKYMV